MFGYYGWQRVFGDVLLGYEIKKQKIMSVLQNVIREIGDIVNRLSGFFEREAEDSGGDSVFGVSVQK